MYAARRRQKSVQWKFQFGKLRIGQPFQLFDNALRQLPQGGFIGHQVALHEPQFVDKPQILLHVPHRGGVFCQTAQHETDVVGVQLFQPTAYHLGGLVISGNPQHLPFGGTGVHKQVYDLIDGVLIVRAEPEQKVYLCREYIRTHYGDAAAEHAVVFEAEGFSGGNLNRPVFLTWTVSTVPFTPT